MWIFLCYCYFYFLLHQVDSFCGSISVFDYVCTTFNSTIIVLSAKPCVSKSFVSFTIMKTGSSSFFYNMKTDKSIDPVRIGNSSTAILLEMQSLSSDIVYKDRLHVKIRAVLLDKSGKRISSDFENIFEAYIPMHPSKCQESILGDNLDKTAGTIKLDQGFVSQNFCDKSMRLGDFSTLCYHSSKGIFLVVLDICTVPYSVNVLAINTLHHVEIMKTFTAKKDVLIPMKAFGGIGGDECGVKLTMFHSHGFSHEKQHTVLAYSCKNQPKAVDIIDDSYYTTYGLVCPESECTKLDVNKQNCTVNVTSNEKAVRMTAEITLNKCYLSKTSAHLNIQVEGFKTFSADLEWSNHFTIRQNANRAVFDLDQNAQVQNGYLPISGGEISLYVKEDLPMLAFHVVVLRHYPEYTDAFPLVRSIFSYNGGELCTKPPSTILVKTLVPIVCILFVLFVVVAVFFIRRRLKQSYNKNGDGLPYQIELNDDDDFEGYETS
ncbi:uncharacterized protein LOC100211712 isoform X2 [Hydra vulgaris]|uniref:Uncharacterized protein LOC100211712 isoform X2 n=1 Tax=Hydra vulgaris TaxID=6087 RepID=A0ABM4B816_HYDVU